LCLVRFNLEPADGVLLYDMTVQRSPDGKLFLYAPMREGSPTASGPQYVKLLPETKGCRQLDNTRVTYRPLHALFKE
jgi:hypothetical protein